MKCPDCDKEIVRIERYQSTVFWEKKGDNWRRDYWNGGTHFHLFCPDYDEYSESGKHECIRWGGDLPDDLYRVIYGPEKPQKRGRQIGQGSK
jgi:hypothetical protein